MLGTAFGEHKIVVQAVRQSTAGTIPDLAEIVRNGETETVNAAFNTPIYVLLLQVSGAYFAYVFGKRTEFWKKNRIYAK